MGTTRGFFSNLPALIVLVMLGSNSQVFCQSGEAKPPAKINSEAQVKAEIQKPLPDLCKDAIDPFRVGAERKKFFIDSGKDNEMTEDEFINSLSKNRGYARIFDRWDAFKDFDKDKNGKINWLEAERCRREFRRVMLEKFDTNRNGHLTGDERKAANKALLEGSIFAKAKSESTRTPEMDTASADAPQDSMENTDSTEETSPEMQEKQEHFENAIFAMLEKFDADGDNKLDGSEFKNMFEQRREEMQKNVARDTFDLNEDGEISDEENSQASVMTEQIIGFMSNAAQYFLDANGDGGVSTFEFATETIKFSMVQKTISQNIEQYWDSDGDGDFTSEERKNMEKTLSDIYTREAQEIHERFDYDGDGILNEEEHVDMAEDLKELSVSQLESFDSNNDGYLDYQEKQAYMEHLFCR